MSDYLDGRHERMSNEQIAKDAVEARDRQTAAYADRTRGMGVGVRRDREAAARTEALKMTLAHLDEGASMDTIFEYADRFTSYILRGNPNKEGSA